MLKLSFKKHPLEFIRPGGTSRGVLRTKPSWILKLENTETQVAGYGEVSIIPKLNPESEEDVEQMLPWLAANINQPLDYLDEYLFNFPSLRFGIESAFLDLNQAGKQVYFPSDFTAGKKATSINGLIWMNDYPTMEKELVEKVEKGFSCIKIKIGAIDISQELKLVALARSLDKNLIIRLDANGAFLPDYAERILSTFAEFDIHSIEQPIKQGQHQEMAKLCEKNIIPIALDEELIGISDPLEKSELLEKIKPQYIILKPSLLGGIKASEEWISEAERRDIQWWSTSALESNLGLNVISQWIAHKNPKGYQGLGTGQLFSNNFESPLYLEGEQLKFDPNKNISLPL